MYFLTLSNADVQFLEKKLIWRSYIIAKALPSTKRVELINKKEFAKVKLDENFKTFVIHVASLNIAPKISQDKVAQIALLLTKKSRLQTNIRILSTCFQKKRF